MLNYIKSPYYSEASKDQKLLAFYKNQKHGEEETNSSKLLSMHWNRKGFQKALVKYIVLDELPLGMSREKGLVSTLGI